MQEATEKFQLLGRVHALLADPEKRQVLPSSLSPLLRPAHPACFVLAQIYDETGQVVDDQEDGVGSHGDFDWWAHARNGPVPCLHTMPQ